MRHGPIEGPITDLLAAVPMTTSTDPALNAAVTTTIIDAYSGVIITLTGAGNAQTLQDPTDTTAGKRFTVVVKGAFDIEVNGITMTGGEAQRFIWDGASWVAVIAVDADDITFTPTGDLVSTNLQAVPVELNNKKADKGANSDITSMTGLDDGGIPVAKVSGALANIVEDTTPQLGGNLDKNEKGIIENITSHSATEAVTVATMYGNIHKITGAYTLTLPAAVVGMSTPMFRASTAAVFSVKAGAACHFEMFDGTVLDNGDKQTSGGTKNEFISFHCEVANVWITNGQNGAMTDGGA